MKIKNVFLKDLYNFYDHPSAILFRAIELSGMYSLVSNIDFKTPSLDLGCGDGAISEMLFEDHFTFGIDNGEAHDVELAISKGRYQKVYLESAEKMSLPSESINFVFSNSVIEHIPDNYAVLSEVSRILKKDGLFLFSSPTRWFADNLYITNILKSLRVSFLSFLYKNYRNKKLNHYHIYDIDIYKQRLQRFNLEVVDYIYTTTESAMNLWDKMAIIYLLVGKLKLKNLINLKKICYSEIMRQLLLQKSSKSYGANLIILAKKNTVR